VKTAYFDTNAFVDVFEDRQPGRYTAVQELVRSRVIRPVASDALLRELVEGSQKASFDLGINRFFSLGPGWMLAGAGLRQRDLILHYFPEVDTDRIEFTTWHQALPRFFEPPEILVAVPDLRIPTPASLKQVFLPELLQKHSHRYDNHLKWLQDTLYERLKKESKETLFAWLVNRVLNGQSRSAAIAAETYADPDIAPAFRISFELDCYAARPQASKQVQNEFLDRLHATIIPFVDFFVTGDEKLLKALKWYDEAVRIPAGRAPYIDRICRVSEFENRATLS
jgi:hypothetical protein